MELAGIVKDPLSNALELGRHSKGGYARTKKRELGRHGKGGKIAQYQNLPHEYARTLYVTGFVLFVPERKIRNRHSKRGRIGNKRG